ncbi:MAG: hypothetical protein K6E70_06920 [Butyrivibrio sp.]|nr:hypothetical protein [Butyrivibrio sp.]
MTNLYKADMKRIFKNPIFIGGCIIALIVTFAFTSNCIGLTGRFGNMEPDRRMFFISIAMMGFFTIFVPLYSNMEYRYGVIRNKITAGFTQKQVYFSHLLSHFTALAVMMGLYLVAGILGGARDFGKMISSNLILFLALCGYISALMLITTRVLKIVLVSIFAFFLLNVIYMGTMIGNALLSFVLKGAAKQVGVIVYNMSVFGQWFSRTGLADDYVNPGSLAQVVVSAAVILVMVFLATVGLDKRDLK